MGYHFLPGCHGVWELMPPENFEVLVTEADSEMGMSMSSCLTGHTTAAD